MLNIMSTFIFIAVILSSQITIANENKDTKNNGTIKIHSQLSYQGLNARDIEVYLPPNYANQVNSRYPVLYMQDGQAMFNQDVASPKSFNLNITADRLIHFSKIKPIIIVAIHSTAARNREYSPSETADTYMNFIINKVKPLVDKRYRTLPDKEHTAIGGASLGGLFSFMIGMKYPDVFSKIACLSPYFGLNQQLYASSLKENYGDSKNLTFYIDNGDIGLDDKLQPGIDEILAYLKVHHYVVNKDLFWFKVNDAAHNNKAWAARISKPLEIFFKK
jgi:predicted alpha/beta superfamily hydrolase